MSIEFVETQAENEKEELISPTKTSAKLQNRLQDAFDFELGGEGKGKKKRKYIFNQNDEDLEFLNRTKLCSLIEYINLLNHILGHEFFQGSLEANQFDMLLLLNDAFDKNVEYRRNYLRVKQNFDNSVAWAQKFKTNLEHVLRNIRAKDKDEDVRTYLRKMAKSKF